MRRVRDGRRRLGPLHVCAGTWLIPVAPAPGLGLTPCHICAGTGPHPRPHLRHAGLRQLGHAALHRVFGRAPVPRLAHLQGARPAAGCAALQAAATGANPTRLHAACVSTGSTPARALQTLSIGAPLRLRCGAGPIAQPRRARRAHAARVAVRRQRALHPRVGAQQQGPQLRSLRSPPVMRHHSHVHRRLARPHTRARHMTCLQRCAGPSRARASCWGGVGRAAQACSCGRVGSSPSAIQASDAARAA